MTQITQFLRGFQAHPASVNESYFGHMRFALGFAATLLAAGGAALIHAFIPPLFETTASTKIRQLHDKIARRH